MNDYRANEKTFQILTQVAGRAGREKDQGRVVIQSYNPQNFAIQCAKEQNYEKFYQTEIELRKQLKYPPFCDIIVVGFESYKINEIQEVSNKIYEFLDLKLDKEKYNVFKPLPSPIDKIQNRNRYRIIIKGKLDENGNKILNQSIKELENLNKKDTYMTIEVNPNNMI